MNFDAAASVRAVVLSHYLWRTKIRSTVKYGLRLEVSGRLYDISSNHASHVKIPPFDMHAPFDAPIRARERQDDLACEKAAAALRDPKVQRKLRTIVREAYAKARRAHHETRIHRHAPSA